MDETLKRTPLFDNHVSRGAKMVPFAGWEMPVQYVGVIPEHISTRSAAGLFDVSHMGEVFVTGAQAEKAIQALTCNDISVMSDGRAQYNAIINHNGGVVDDIIVYRFSKERYLICVNASNTDKDYAWFQKYNTCNAHFENVSSEYGQIALQGPKALSIFEKLSKKSGDARSQQALQLKAFHFLEARLCGAEIIVARTGYTGEDGFEFFVPASHSAALWEALLEIGALDGLSPVGLGARDSLRLEACYPLHGHELGDDISAIESGLGWIVKLDKGDFIGKEVLMRHKKEGTARSLAGFFVDDPGIARHGDKVFDASGAELGWVTSGTKTPTLNRALGLAIVATSKSAVGQALFIEVRGKRLKSTVAKRPFYSALKKVSS